MRETGFSHKTLINNNNNNNKNSNLNDNYVNDSNYSDRKSLHKNISPKMYRKSVVRSKNLGTYSICINDHTNENTFFNTNLPSKDEILESLKFVNKKNKISCDLRIVEIGVLMKVRVYTCL
jgi:hypothetical protein